MNIISRHYNQFFEVYTTSSSVDANNFEIESMVVTASGFGYFEPLDGNERYISDKYQSYTTHRLFCQPTVCVTEKDEIRISSTSYNIDLVQNLRNNHLELILILRK